MPVEITGFTFKPDNFFEGNPAVDLPPERNAASRLATGCCGAGTSGEEKTS
jgi:primary-amine oxidase